MAPKERPPPWPFDLDDGLVNERHPDRLRPENTEAGAVPQDDDAPPSAVDLADDISPLAFGPESLLSTVVNMADWGASHLRSASESAWRGDVALAGDHLRQAANAIKAAQMTYAAIAKTTDAELGEATQ